MSGVIIGAAVIGAAATIYSADQASDAAKDQAAAQRDASAAQGRMASADAARERIKQAREARIRAATIQGAASGIGLGAGTSGLSGSIGSISSQMASNIGTINQTEGFAAEISAANQRGADAQADMMKWQAWGNVGQTIFSQSAARIK